MNKKNPYVLGLDLGTASIGWSIIPLDSAAIDTDNINMGVVIVDEPIDKKKKTPLNVDRRNARQQRRMKERKNRRKVHLFNCLQRAGLLPSTPCHTPFQRQDLLNELDSTHYGLDISGNTLNTMLYQLRSMALDQKLAIYAIGRVLYQLAERRGFKSNRKDTTKDNEDGEVKKAIAGLGEEIDKAGSRTIGEHFAAYDTTRKKIRQTYTSREWYEDEFDLIWAKQSSYYPDVLTDALRTEIRDIIYYQRPLKAPKRGMCDLEKGQPRVDKADVSFQRFRYWQVLNNLEVKEDHKPFRPLKGKEKALLAQKLEVTKKVSFDAIRKLLGLSESAVFNYEDGGEKCILGNATAASIHKVLKSHKIKASEQLCTTIADRILAFDNEEALIKNLARKCKISREVAAELANITLEQGVALHSKRAIERILNKMKHEGKSYATALKELYPERNTVGKTYDLLPPVDVSTKGTTKITNPSVYRVLTQLRKLVNALVREYGKPAMIRIELARELKHSKKSKAKFIAQKKVRDEEREAAKKGLADLGIENPTEANIRKYVIAERCNWTCVYTGEKADKRVEFGPHPQFDIDHIQPFSRSGNNSLSNKVLCLIKENRHVKKNQTPMECYGEDEERWEEIMTRVDALKGPDRLKTYRLFTTTIEDNDSFTARSLTDTSYISKKAVEYVSLLFGGSIDAKGKRRVFATKGGITGRLRREWGLNDILGDDGEKNRADHRHHAIDALVIALSTPAIVKKIGGEDARPKEDILPPVDNLADVVREVLEKVNVVYRCSQKVRGKLHEETITRYPGRRQKGTGEVYCIGTGERTRRYVHLKANHHMEVVEGKGGRWEAVVVPLMEAYRRKKEKLPIVNRNHGDKRFVCSLTIGDFFMVDDENGKKALYVVRMLSGQIVGYMEHTDGRLQRTSGEDMSVRRTSINQLRQRGFKKVRLDMLGNLSKTV